MLQERRKEIALWFIIILGLTGFLWTNQRELILAMGIGQLAGWLVSKDNGDPRVKRMAHLMGAAIGFAAYLMFSFLESSGG